MPIVNKGKPDLTKKVMPAVIVRKPWHRKGFVNMYLEDNAVVIVSPKSETEGSAITSQLGKCVLIFEPRNANVLPMLLCRSILFQVICNSCFDGLSKFLDF